MSTTATDPTAAVKAQAEQIIGSGTDVRQRLAEVVAQHAGEAPHAGGLVALVRAVIDGAREGFDRSVPQNREDALRQVLDALGDGLSQAALAGQLALQEAAGSSRQFEKGDLTRLGDDLTAVRALFAETIDQGLAAGKAFTTAQVVAAKTHARRVAERLDPVVTRALDAVRQHPLAVAREGIQAGVGAGQCATGALFQALGHMLQRAGDQMRREPGRGE
jgi:hypothetical protein